MKYIQYIHTWNEVPNEDYTNLLLIAEPQVKWPL